MQEKPEYQITPPSHFKYEYVSCMHYYKMALKKAAEISEEAVDDVMRRLGETDLYFLLVFICNRPDMIHPWIFERAREVQLNPDNHLDLWARNHYKSTIITFGHTLLDIIQDREVTIGIFSHTKGIAKDFVKQIKTELENNKMFHKLWPDTFFEHPERQSKKWSEDALRVKRKSNPKEETIEACGLVEGMPTGKHFRHLIYDDVVTVDGVKTPEQMSKTTDARKMASNLGMKGNRIRRIGTRYHLFDDYHDIIDNKIAIPRIHAATDDGTEFGNPVFLTRDELAEKRKDGPYVFSSQQLLNPVADKSMGFRMEWVVKSDTDYHSAMQNLWRFIIVDPAGSKQRKDNDYTSMFVIGHGLDEKYRVLDIVRDRMNLSKRTEVLFALHKKWEPGVVAYEEYGMQADIEHIKYVQEKELYEFDITAIGGSMKKELRILRLVPYFENGYKDVENGGDGIPKSRIIFPISMTKIDYEGQSRDLVTDFFQDEYVAFPVLKHDDMIDCLSRIVDLEQEGLIEKPSVTPPEIKSTRVEDALKKVGQKDSDSWLIA